MRFDRDKPDFERDGRHWPHRDKSRFVDAGGIRFHVQEMGEGPGILLIHGTGASTHSFRDVAPLLATDHRVTMFDLPGHAFTETPVFIRMTLPGVAASCGALLDRLGIDPVCVVGHSAGAAVAIRMALDGLAHPRALVGFNASLKPFAGAAGPIFSTLAKVLFVNPLTPRLFAASATEGRVRKLLSDTGSRLSPEGVAYYRTLFRRAGHCSGALALMAGWDLNALQRDLPKLEPELTLVAASLDRTIPPADAAFSTAKVRRGRIVRMGNLGHLAHEEDPAAAAAIIREAIAHAGAEAARAAGT
jgi:magnesium chelatase accessory protein